MYFNLSPLKKTKKGKGAKCAVHQGNFWFTSTYERDLSLHIRFQYGYVSAVSLERAGNIMGFAFYKIFICFLRSCSILRPPSLYVV